MLDDIFKRFKVGYIHLHRKYIASWLLFTKLNCQEGLSQVVLTKPKGQVLNNGVWLQAVADSKKVVSDDDILALLGDEANQTPDLWALIDLQVSILSRDTMYLSRILGLNDSEVCKQ